jgi:hypothetical protein
MTEMGTIIVVRNTAIVAGATVVSNGLWLLPFGPLRLLGALWLRLVLCLLCTLWLCLVLRLLLALRLLLLLCLLGALWLLLLLRLLSTLRLCLALCRLGALRLLLLLRLLGFPSALFLLAFLCECRNGGCEK